MTEQNAQQGAPQEQGALAFTGTATRSLLALTLILIAAGVALIATRVKVLRRH